jgi:hypothetical protein
VGSLGGRLLVQMLIHNSLQIAFIGEIAARMSPMVRVFIDMHVLQEEWPHECLRCLDTIPARVDLNLRWIFSISKVDYLLALLSL